MGDDIFSYGEYCDNCVCYKIFTACILQTKNYFKVGTVHGVGDRETKIPLDIQGAVWDGAKVRGECTSIGLCIELGVCPGVCFYGKGFCFVLLID